MNGYKKLWYGGYGKYNYYTVAEDKEEALKQLREKHNLRALPVDCQEINNIDGHIIIPVSESELNKSENVPVNEVKEPAGIKEMFGINDSPNISTMSRADLIQLAKELDVDGKIATFKTEDLRGKVGEKLEAISKESGRSE